MDIQNLLVPQMTLLTIFAASIVPLLIIAWLLAPLLCRLIVAAAKVSVCTIPLIAIIALGFHLKRKIDAAEEERMRRIAAAEYEQRERMRRTAVAECEQKERQQKESLRHAQAQLQAEVQRRREAESLVKIMRRNGVRPTTPPRSPPRQPELSGPAAWIANVFETVARASGDAAAASGQHYRDSPAGASARPAVDTSSGGECVVCYNSAVDTLLMPCKHLALCGDEYWKAWGRCPVCKTLVVDQIKVYRS